MVKKRVTDDSTEEKIKDAARMVFTEKGYAATRTRDIAEKAGINLALLNYYFRSKEKLFDMIMLEKLMHLMKGIVQVANDPEHGFVVVHDQDRHVLVDRHRFLHPSVVMRPAAGRSGCRVNLGGPS